MFNGTYDNHAKLGAGIAKNLLESSGNFSKSEINQIEEAIANHSDKHLYSDNPLVELIKDADCFDCFFYADNIYDSKPNYVLKHYYKRIIKIRQEFGLPAKKYFGDRLKIIEER